MSADTTGHYPVLAVVTSTGHAIRFFHGETYELFGELAVLAQPHEIATDPKRVQLYVSHTYRSGAYPAPGVKAHEISVIDPYRRELSDVISLAPEEAPHGLAFDPNTDLLYVSVEASTAGGGALVAIDAATRKVVRRIETGAPGPHWAVITPDGTKAYTANKETPFVSVLDLEQGRLTRHIPMPHGSEELTITPDGRHVYVAAAMINYLSGGKSQPPASLKVIDTHFDKVTHTLALDHPASPVHVASNGQVLTGLVPFASSGMPTDGRLEVYQPTETGALHHYSTTLVGKVPLTIRTTPDSTRAFVSNLRSGTLDIIDLTTGSRVHSLDIDPATPQGAHGIAYLQPQN